MVDQWSTRRRDCEGTSATPGTLAGRKGSCSSVWPAAVILSAVATIKSRGRLVARESSNLFVRGAFDWIMSREDSELIASYVNRNGDLASFYEIPNTGHTFQ